MDMMSDIMTEPLWLQAWVGWMMLINTASLFFLSYREPRVVLGVWIGNIITMTGMYEYFGYVRFLGLSHVIWWTPLVIFLVMRLSQIEKGKRVRTWILVLIATNVVSLVVDYIDVARYLLGEREPML